MFKNMKIRTKILSGFGMAIIMYIISICVGVVSLSSVANALDRFYHNPYPMVKAASDGYERGAAQCLPRVRGGDPGAASERPHRD